MRPSKLTDELCDNICDDIRKGASLKESALVNGISESTFYRWIQRGKEGESPYFEFRERINQSKKLLFDYNVNKTQHEINAKTERTNTYFISDGEFVKIGISKDPQLRLSYIQTHYPKIVHIVKLFPYNCERKLHRRFKHLKVNGEWFKFDKEIADYLGISLIGEVV